MAKTLTVKETVWDEERSEDLKTRLYAIKREIIIRTYEYQDGKKTYQVLEVTKDRYYNEITPEHSELEELTTYLEYNPIGLYDVTHLIPDPKTGVVEIGNNFFRYIGEISKKELLKLSEIMLNSNLSGATE